MTSLTLLAVVVALAVGWACCYSYVATTLRRLGTPRGGTWLLTGIGLIIVLTLVLAVLGANEVSNYQRAHSGCPDSPIYPPVLVVVAVIGLALHLYVSGSLLRRDGGRGAGAVTLVAALGYVGLALLCLFMASFCLTF